MEGIMKIVKSLSGTFQNKTKEQRGGFLSMLLGNLETSLLGNLLAGKRTIRAGEGTVRPGENL